MEAMEMSELKRCPFCGGKPTKYDDYDVYWNGEDEEVTMVYSISCHSCRCKMEEWEGDAVVLDKRWNKRRADGLDAWIEVEKDKLFDDVRGYWRMQALRDVQRQLNKLLNGLGIDDE
jgi:hypothetical protein